jgi:hypothetical protein
VTRDSDGIARLCDDGDRAVDELIAELRRHG